MLSTNNIQTPLFVYGEWYPSEMRLLQPPEDLATADWAEKTPIYIVKSSKPGPWSNGNNPPLAGIMNAADRKGIFANLSLMVICKGVQTGGSEAIYIILFKRMDGSTQTALLVMENEKKVRKIFKQRLLVTIKHTPRLAAQLSENPDDVTASSIRLRSNFFLNAGWSGSQASVASDACETVIIDEVDKFTEAMNIEEAKDRITAYPDTGLVVVNSTPGEDGGPIMTELEGCDTVMDYHVECPDCGAVQVMDFEHFFWPDKEKVFKSHEERKRHANLVQRDKLARYACAGCGSLWDDAARDKAVRLGARHHFHGWKMRGDIPNPASVGFHLPSWISPFKSLSKVAARWLKAQDPSQPGKLRGWHNQEAAEPFIEKHSERKEDAILALRDDRPRGLVPKGISCLVLLADTQQRGFYYEVRAFGWGPPLDSWQVREGFVESRKALEDILYNSEYVDCDGVKHVITAGGIDSGGGTGTVPNHSRTAEVYEFCRQNPIMRPLKGRQRMTQTVSPSQIDYYPRTKKPIPGGLTLYHVNVTYFKDQLSAKLSIHPDDPGAWRLHSECPVEYARHMVAEYRDEKGLWQCPKSKPNHYWDIGVYGLALAEILQVKYWKNPAEGGARPTGRRVVSKGAA